MYIGVKSDIFQLGMVLWAIAMEQDEPETQPRPLTLVDAPEEIPSYYRALVAICLSDDPRNRSHATALLGMFPEIEDDIEPFYERQPTPDHMDTEYIDPETAVGRDDIDNFRVLSSQSSEANGIQRSSATHTYVNAPTDMSGEAYYYPTRGRSPPPRSLRDVDEPPLTQNRYEHTNGNHGLQEQSNGYFEPRAISVSQATHPEIQAVDQDSAPHSKSLCDVDELGLVQSNNDHKTEDNVQEEPSSSDFQPQLNAVSPLEPQGIGDIEKGSVLHSESLDHVVESTPFQDNHDHKIEDNVLEEPSNSHFEPQAVTIPPLGQQETRGIGKDSKLHSITDSTTGDMEKPRNTEAAPAPVPEELAGIGEHSTIEHSDFPQGVLDDDLTTDMEEPPCTF
jgi:hypothetical protein